MRIRSAVFNIIILVIFFILQYHFFSPRIHSFSFGDETEHLAPAYGLMQQDKKLYKNLSTNHQPIPVITSKIFLELFGKSNPYMFIQRLRQFMFLISFLGALVLVLRFGLTGLLASICLEAIKFYLFGYHLLAESLVIYPVMIASGLLFESLTVKNKTENYLDEILFSLSLFLIIFNLLPAWPFVLITLIVYLTNHKNLLSRLIVLGTILASTVILFLYVDLVGWFKQTIGDNYLYFFPSQEHINLLKVLSFIFYPVKTILSLNQPVSRYYFILSAAIIIFAIFVKVFKKRGSLNFILFGLAYFLFILLNVRVDKTDVSFYTAFHLLPQLAFLTFLTFFIIKEKYIFLLTTLLVLLSSLYWWTESRNFSRSTEYFVQYSPEESIGFAINAIKQPEDTLLSGPQKSFINLFADIPQATSQTAYLPWSFKSPLMQDEFKTVLIKNPPTFVYFPKSDNPYFEMLSVFLQKDYLQIKRTTGETTDLYMLKTRIDRPTPAQWQNFRNFLYEPPVDGFKTKI